MSLKQIDGLPIIDAKKGLMLTITPKDISRADLKDPADCVVARACRREVQAQEVRVHLARIYVRTNKGSWTRYVTPLNMRSEIIAFDRGGTFEPQTFELKTPSEAKQAKGTRQGGKTKKGYHGRNNPNRKKRKSPAVVKNVRIGPAG